MGLQANEAAGRDAGALKGDAGKAKGDAGAVRGNPKLVKRGVMRVQ